MTDVTFADLGLGPNVLKAVEEAGYTTPTPIQAEAIPHILAGGDVTGIAQTGTGKTAAFVLPMIHRLARGRARARMPRCLILCPTRELAAQVGFIPDIEKIVSKIPAKRQTLLFSATFPTDIQRLAKTFQRDPVKIEVARPTDAAKTITQHVVHIPTNDAKAKRTALRRVIESRDVKNGIVFCNRKVEVDIVAASLQKHGHDAAAIHGDLPQAFRTQVLQRFRDGDLKLLVASDVAARGLDIPDVGHVFNYSPPPKDEDYVHRIGRTGRAGRTGESFTVVSPSDEKSWGFVLKMIQQDVEDYMPEGLLEELGDLPPDESRSRGRSRSGSRDDKSRGGRSRSRRRDENTDKLEEATPAESKPKAKAEEPKAKTEPKSDAQTDDRPEEKPKRERVAKPKRDRERDRKRKDDDPILDPAPEKVKGFGSDIPAFLKR